MIECTTSLTFQRQSPGHNIWIVYPCIQVQTPVASASACPILISDVKLLALSRFVQLYVTPTLDSPTRTCCKCRCQRTQVDSRRKASSILAQHEHSCTPDNSTHAPPTRRTRQNSVQAYRFQRSLGNSSLESRRAALRPQPFVSDRCCLLLLLRRELHKKSWRLVQSISVSVDQTQCWSPLSPGRPLIVWHPHRRMSRNTLGTSYLRATRSPALRLSRRFSPAYDLSR